MILFGSTDYLKQHNFLKKRCQKTSNRPTPNVLFMSEQPIIDFFDFFLGDHTFPPQSTAWLGTVSRSFCKFWVKISVLRSNHVYSCLKWAKKTNFHYSIIKIAHLDAEIKFDFDPRVFFWILRLFLLVSFSLLYKALQGPYEMSGLDKYNFFKNGFSNSRGVI